MPKPRDRSISLSSIGWGREKESKPVHHRKTVHLNHKPELRQVSFAMRARAAKEKLHA